VNRGLPDARHRAAGNIATPSTVVEMSTASFRDPDGFCFVLDNRILRAVSQQALAEIEPFLGSDIARELTSNRRIIATRRLGESEREQLAESEEFQRLARGRAVDAVFEHERVEFASYPYEWPPEMLYAAGRLTLELAQSCLAHGYGLKDATPYNVLFRGSAPVFIDLLSFERRDPCDPIWRPHAQFCRTFLLPLLAHKIWGIRPADVFTNRRDGLEPAEVFQLCGPVRRLLPPLLTLVSLPTWLSRKAAGKSLYRSRHLSDPGKARFIMESLLKRLRRTLESVRPEAKRRSSWSGYMESHSYPREAFAAKEEFVCEFLSRHQPRSLLDVGANTGHFSALAAKSGAKVVAIDYDLGCIGALWRRAQSDTLNILPLVIDLSRPSARQGWRNRECSSFLDRAGRSFDAVLMLAVLHHLLVTERVPLEEVFELAAELTTRWLVIEFVSPEDELFQSLARGRDSLHEGLRRSTFEDTCRRWFRLIRSQHLEGTHRWLYLLEKVA
jgi:2-polyprenyl-3-methyl-5-hydroxy-6-metoxy-1,4-benzoquinol methylase